MQSTDRREGPVVAARVVAERHCVPHTHLRRGRVRQRARQPSHWERLRRGGALDADAIRRGARHVAELREPSLLACDVLCAERARHAHDKHVRVARA
eukprot:629039-Prymnesium_polylepis.1